MVLENILAMRMHIWNTPAPCKDTKIGITDTKLPVPVGMGITDTKHPVPAGKSITARKAPVGMGITDTRHPVPAGRSITARKALVGMGITDTKLPVLAGIRTAKDPIGMIQTLTLQMGLHSLA